MLDIQYSFWYEISPELSSSLSLLSLCQASPSSAHKKPQEHQNRKWLVRVQEACKNWEETGLIHTTCFSPNGCISMHWSLGIFTERKLCLCELLCTSSVLFVCLNMQFPPHSSGMPVKSKSSWSVVELGNAQNGSACHVLSLLLSGHCTCSSTQEAWLACVATSCFLYRVKLKLLYLV